MLKRAVILAVTSLALSWPAGAASEPHITDPAGDADAPRCTHTVSVGLACVPVPARPSQPSIDILTVDFAARGQAFVADVGVLDLGHTVIGPYGAGAEDGTRYAVAFDIEGGVRMLLELERDSAGGTVRALLWAGTPNSESGSTVASEIDATADAAADRIRFEVPIATLAEAVRVVCSSCPPVSRGMPFLDPWATASVLDREAMVLVAEAAHDVTVAGTPYVLGH